MKNIEITITQSSADRADILLEGELILKYLQEVMEQIMLAVAQHSAIVVKLRKIVCIDLACIQLLFAIKQSASTANKTFACEIETPEEIKNLLINTGLADLADLLNTAAK